MKKIQKFQLGGGTYVPSVANPLSPQAMADLAAAASSSKSKKSGDDDLISKETLKEIQQHGIPVDVNKFMQQLAAIEEEAAMGLGLNKHALYALLAEANRIVQQYDYLVKAEKTAESNLAIGEIAVGSRGELFTINNGKIKTVSMHNYDPEKDGPALTVGELIEHRKFNPTQAFDTSITLTVRANIGMQKINEWLLEIVKLVGSAETTSEAYVDLASYVGKLAAKRPTESQLLALQQMYQIMQLIGPDALFKTRDVISEKNLTEALNYIQSVLPRDMQTQLAGRFVALGGDLGNSGKYMLSLIAGALTMANDTKVGHYIDYESSLNQAAGTKAGNKELNRNLGVLELLVLGSLGKRDYKLMNSKNPEYSLNLHGTGVGSLATFDNNIVDKTPISVALKAGLAPLVDENHMSIGNLKITAGMLDTILYNGGDVINVWAPVNSDGDVDLDGLAYLSEIQSICETNPQLTVEDKNNLLKKYDLDGYFDNNGTFHGSGNMAQFLVMTGITSEKVIDNGINPYADKLSRDEKKFEFEQIDRIYGQLNKGAKSSGKYEFKTGWFNATTDLYRAPVFMRLNLTAQIDAGTFSGKGPVVQTPTYAQQLAYDQMRYARENRPLIQPSSASLYE